MRNRAAKREEGGGLWRCGGQSVMGGWGGGGRNGVCGLFWGPPENGWPHELGSGPTLRYSARQLINI